MDNIVTLSIDNTVWSVCLLIMYGNMAGVKAVIKLQQPKTDVQEHIVLPRKGYILIIVFVTPTRSLEIVKQ